jgi:nucleoside-diphosphate-sugar epimerase
VAREGIEAYLDDVDAVIHMAAIVAFPACQAVGPEVAPKYIVEAVQRVFDTSEEAGAERFPISCACSSMDWLVRHRIRNIAMHSSLCSRWS